MSEPTELAPALSAEEWAEMDPRKGGALIGIAYYLIEHDGLTFGWSKDHGTHLDHAELPRVIAIANHALPDDDPRKITRAMVAWLETLATDVDNGGREIFDSDAVCLHAIAKTLATLLPPATDERET